MKKFLYIILIPVVALILIIIAFFPPNIAFNVNIDAQWNKNWGGWKDDSSRCVQQTADGGYIVVGSTVSYGSGNSDLWLIKTDNNGNKLWDKTFGGSDWDSGYFIQQTDDDGFIIIGSTNSFGPDNDVWLIKTDADGNKQWDKTFDFEGNDIGNCIEITSDGGFIITGSTGQDILLMKTDNDGNKLWDNIFGGDNTYTACSVKETADKGYILVGSTRSFGSGSEDVFLIKTDSLGQKLWDKTFGETGNDTGYSVLQSTDGGYILTGTYNNEDIWLIKTDENGIEKWNKKYDSSGYDTARCVQQDRDGGYIIVGYKAIDLSEFNSDIWLVKTDSEGNMLWEQSFGGDYWDLGYFVQNTDDGGYIITGVLSRYNHRLLDIDRQYDENIWLIKVAAPN